MRVVVKTFDTALAESSPEQFARQVLVGELGAVRIVVGQNFRFGKGRSGDSDDARRARRRAWVFGARHGDRG